MYRAKLQFVFMVVLSVSVAAGGAGALWQALRMTPEPTPTAAAATVAPEADHKGPHSVTVFRGGLIDPIEQTAFVVNPKSDLDAVDLRTGKVLWQTTEGSYWPLATYDRRLVARLRTNQQNAIRVVVLDLAQKGKLLLKSDLIEFPAWVFGPDWMDNIRSEGRRGPFSINDTFQSRERIEKGNLLIDWEAHYEYTENDKLSRKDAYGSARVNLQTGKVQMKLEEKKPPVEAKLKEPEKPFGKVQVGNCEYFVGQEDRGIITKVLKAVDKKSGKLLWQHPLKDWLFEPIE